MSSTDHDEDVASEAGGDDVYRQGAAAAKATRPVASSSAPTGFTREAPTAAIGFGRGPIPRDGRRFRYDINAAKSRAALSFGATKVDRLDATQAGDVLHSIHVMFGLDKEIEERIFAFDQALWYEHAVNGGSTLQASRGFLYVDTMQFELALIIKKLGIDARRFFRAYADDIAECLQIILRDYDPYDPTSAEKHGAIMQVAVTRGLQKYPYLIHDSSDAGLRMSVEERAAVLTSKRIVIPSVINQADAIVGRVGPVAGYASPAAAKEIGTD